MEKIRVLTIVSGLAVGDLLGGAERFGIELACHLDRERFEPIICGFWFWNKPSEQLWLNRLTSQGISAFFAVKRPSRFGLRAYIRGVLSILNYFKGTSVHIIHSHFQLGSLTALLIRRALQAKGLVRTAHGAFHWEWSNTFIGWICRQVFTQWVFPIGFDVEVGVSEYVTHSLNLRLGALLAGKSAHLIYNGINPNRFITAQPNPEGRIVLGLDPKAVVIGSVGRLTEQKGYSFLLEAAPKVIEKMSNVRFLIIGDGELRDKLQRQIVKLGLQERVILAGAYHHIESVYKLFDLFVLPSLWEGLPTVILEAMASGVPVVATDIPGTRELIRPGETGWLARPRDPSSLAHSILDALSDPSKRTTIAQNAFQEVISRFSMDRIADQYEELYLDLINRWAY